jgi:predicted DsbA family dithiol-disulfide isomerase
MPSGLGLAKRKCRKDPIMEKLIIDVVSDVVCPWCYLGKARLEKALAEVEPQGIAADVTFRPFQLNPDFPPEGVDQRAHLAAKFGGEEALDRAHAQLAELGKEDGLDYHFDKIKIGPNTLDAHRLIHWAMQEGNDVHLRAVDLLFKANFEEGRNVGDPAVLLDIGQQAGLDRAVVERLLYSEADKDTIKQEIEQAQKMGVSGVPFIIIDQKYAVSGAQPAQVLANAFRQIAAEKERGGANLN